MPPPLLLLQLHWRAWGAVPPFQAAPLCLGRNSKIEADGVGVLGVMAACTASHSAQSFLHLLQGLGTACYSAPYICQTRLLLGLPLYLL